MLKIPETYYKNNQDYITIPVMKQFMISNKDGNFRISQSREELISSIIDYGNKKPQNEQKVLKWLDEVLFEGIKDVYLSFKEFQNEAIKNTFINKEKCDEILSKHIHFSSTHICLNNYDGKLSLVNYDLSNSGYGNRLILSFCKKLYLYERKTMSVRVVDYPIFAEYYFDYDCLLIRAKPRSGLFEYSPEFNIETAIPTSIDKQIKEAEDAVSELLQLNSFERKASIEQLKYNIFVLLDRFTQTPKCIDKVLDEKDRRINETVELILQICNEQERCNDITGSREDIKSDIKNIVEKYLSVNWKDSNVFMDDREAFPVKLSATDEEESKVEQTAAMEQPLQTKALFFDNKKMLYKNKKCDGITFQWKRQSNNLFDDDFKVIIHVNTKGNCIFKFSKYTERKDIDNVIFSVVKNEGVS